MSTQPAENEESAAAKSKRPSGENPVQFEYTPPFTPSSTHTHTHAQQTHTHTLKRVTSDKRND